MSSVTPGRATDALVAEKLGWTICDDDNCDGSCGCRLFKSDRGADGVWECATEDADGKQSPWSPSTSPVDAISALEATGKHYTISKDDGCYHIQVWRDEEHQAQGDEFCTAPTLCLAACRAILQLPTPHPPEPA